MSSYMLRNLKVFNLRQNKNLIEMLNLTLLYDYIQTILPRQFDEKQGNNFEVDYWGLSNKSALEYIIANDNKEIIKITRASFTSLESSLLILQKDQAKRIKIVHDLEKADYVIDNYRKGWGKIKNIDLLATKFVKLHDIKVDDIVINTIYKKIN